MPFAAIFGFLRPFLPYILCAIAVGGAYLYADEFWHNAVAVRAERELDGIKTSLAKEALRQKENQTRAAQNEELRAKNNELTRTTKFQPLKQKASALPAVAIPGSGAAVSVLNAAASAANVSGAASKPEETAATNTAVTDLKALTEWGVEVLEIHKECRDRVTEWETWYEDLRSGH